MQLIPAVEQTSNLFLQEALSARQSLDALLRRRPAFWAVPPQSYLASASVGNRQEQQSSTRAEGSVSANGTTGRSAPQESCGTQVAARRSAAVHAAMPEGPRSIPGFLVRRGTGNCPAAASQTA